MCSAAILFICDLFQPLDDFAFQVFLNRNVRHCVARRSPMPMLQAGREPDDIAGKNFLDRTALALHPTNTERDNKRLTNWMRVPRGASARLERDTRASGAR